MSKTTAIYVRVSHRDQSHASQMPDLERWAEAHDGSVEWFRDTFTGRTMDRPGMSKLNDELRAGRLCRIVVWRLDRLGRTTRGLCQLFDELRERRSISSRSKTGSPCPPQPVGSMPASWRA
jgi:DNA invertase Pin-like site-specific DNA recombinase